MQRDCCRRTNLEVTEIELLARCLCLGVLGNQKVPRGSSLKDSKRFFSKHHAPCNRAVRSMRTIDGDASRLTAIIWYQFLYPTLFVDLATCLGIENVHFEIAFIAIKFCTSSGIALYSFACLMLSTGITNGNPLAIVRLRRPPKVSDPRSDRLASEKCSLFAIHCS